jgi:hypothetical protein
MMIGKQIKIVCASCFSLCGVSTLRGKQINIMKETEKQARTHDVLSDCFHFLLKTFHNNTHNTTYNNILLQLFKIET